MRGRRPRMSTQGEQILQQLRKYEVEKRLTEPVNVYADEDELLNSQIGLLQLSQSPGTLAEHNTHFNKENEHTEETRREGYYTSLKILASKPRYFPPLNFGVVNSDIYRSGHPQKINYPFLESLKLKTIIYVGDKTNNWEYYAWVKSQPGVQFKHFPLEIGPMAGEAASGSFEATQEMNREMLAAIAAIVCVPANLPVLIHSNKGKHRVGMAVAAIRRENERWTLAAIYDEFGKYARNARDTGGLDLIGC